MEMQLDHLRTLQAVARFGSFSQAGAHRNLTQPAVSMQIRLLEDGLGVRLLERRGRRVRPTLAGALLLEHAERALGELARGVQRVHALRGVVAGPLRLGTGTAISMYLLPPLVRVLKARHPAVDLVVTTGTAADVVRAVIEADLDVGVVGLPVRGRELIVSPFLTDDLVAIAAPRHWRTRAPLTARALVHERLILDQPGAMSRRLIEGWLRRERVTPTVPAELTNTEATKELVRAGLGVSIAPWFSVRRDVAAGRLAVRRLRPALAYPLGVVRRREATPAPPLQAVLTALDAVRSSLDDRRHP
jgi:DNA-binding transcriptional LysR family regulator